MPARPPLAPLPPVWESANIPCPHLTIEQPRTLIEKSGISSPVTITEEVLRTDAQLIIAAAREPLNNTLAGNLVDWKVLRTGAPPHYTREIIYKTELPFPFSARTFNIESWFMPTTHLPTSLRAASFCFIAQTPLGKVAKGVAGDVMFSGYLCIPLPDETTWLRRVLAVELNLPCVPRSLELAALRSTVRSDHIGWTKCLHRTSVHFKP